MNIKEKALIYATRAHKGQVRKTEPEKEMIIHPIGVANILEEYGCDDNVIAAGYLHDVVEDTKYTLEDIEKEFGEDIKNLVDAASESDKSLSWEERKLETINKTRKLDQRKKLVIVADKINNIESMQDLFKRNGEDFSGFKRGKKEQEWYYRSIYLSLILNDDHDNPLYKRLEEGINKVFNRTMNEYYLEELIFDDDLKYYEQLNEIKTKLENRDNSYRDYSKIIEFTGTPRTGKTSAIDSINELLRKEKIDVGIMPEFTTSGFYKTIFSNNIKDQSYYDKNISISDEITRRVINERNTKKYITLVDRGVFDRCVWMRILFNKGMMTKKEYLTYMDSKISVLEKTTDKIIIMYTDSLTALKRDKKNSLTVRESNFMKYEKLEEFNQALVETMVYIKKISPKLNISLYDTTNKPIRDTNVTIINDIIDETLTKKEENKYKILAVGNGRKSIFNIDNK